jgi:glucokinase
MKIGGKTAFAAMRKGCRDSAEVVDYYIKHLGTGIANLINIFQPNVFSIGGGVCNEKDYLLKPLCEKVAKETYGNGGGPRTEIKIAELGNDAGILGAAVLGL